jgi:hypothetical protein
LALDVLSPAEGFSRAEAFSAAGAGSPPPDFSPAFPPDGLLSSLDALAPPAGPAPLTEAVVARRESVL